MSSDYIPHKCDLTDEEILTRAARLDRERLEKRRRELREEARLERVRIRADLKAAIEMYIPTDKGMISELQLNSVITAFTEYNDALNGLYEA